MLATLRNRFMNTFRGRLALLYIAVEFSILLISAFLLYFFLSRQVYQQVDEDLYREASALVYQLERNRFYFWSLLLDHFAGDFSGAVQMVSLRGVAEFTSGDDLMARGDSHIDSVYQQIVRGKGVAFASTSTLLGKKNIRVLALPVHRGQQLVAVLLVARSTGQIQSFFTLLYWIGGILGFLSIIISAWAGYIMALKALNPIKEINRTARAVAAGDLTRRLKSRAQEKEISELVLSLNRMFQSLENSFVAQKHFTADASHELRIPLTILKGEVEVALRKVRSAEEYRVTLSHSLSIIERMQRIVDDLLMLARADAGQLELAQEEIDFSLSMQEVYQQHLILFSQKKLQLEADIQDELQVLGDASALERVMYNLLNNAYKYAPEGSSVLFNVYAHNEYAVVQVQDYGCGIPVEHHQYLFSRFYRSDAARAREHGGAGLGLAICKRIIDAHGGDIEVRSVPDEGCCFIVRIPLSKVNPNLERRLQVLVKGS